MGLSQVLGNALDGLRVTQTSLDVVSQNVSNAGSVGYVARRISNVEQTTAGVVSGVRTAQVQRLLDRLVQQQLWTETSGAGYTGVRANSLKAVDQLYGAPGSTSALDTLYSNFTSSLQALKSDPSNYTLRSQVLNSAGQLAAQLNNLSQGVQSLRSQAESSIDSAVKDVNDLLSRLQSVNGQLVGASGERGNPALEDERDRIVSNLATYMDIRTTIDSDNRMSIVTNAGLTLFDGANATKFQFDARPNMGPQSQFTANPATRTVGTLSAVDAMGGTVDVTAGHMLRSGQLAGLFELRDTSLQQMQNQLDEIAAQMSSALSDTPVAGAAVTAGAAAGFDVDLTGLQPGNSITLDYKLTPSGQVKSFTFLRVNSASSLPLPAGAAGDTNNPVVGIDFSGGMASVVSQIQTAVGAGFAVSTTGGNVLRIVDDGAAGTTDVSALTARVTNTALSNSGASAPVELPLFVDSGRNNAVYTGSFEGSWQKTGFAARIAINPALLADNSKLVVYGTSPATLSGDATRPTLMYDRLTSASYRFAPSTGIGGSASAYTGTIANYVQQSIVTQGQAAENATALNEGQKVAKAAMESRFSETSAVSVDKEMSSLIELQTAYAANARIISAVKDMMDLLLRN